MRASRRAAALLAAAAAAALACAPSGTAARGAPAPADAAPTAPAPYTLHPADPRAEQRWVDSVLATLSLRDRAAQMVWPSVLGDYVAADAPEWRRLRSQIETQKVGGYTISVGSPLEIAAKLDAMQRMAAVPLLVGADLEFGAGYRARGGWFLPNAIDLGGATLYPPEMAIGATRDTALACDQGRVTAIEGRALGITIDYAPILDVNNNPANPVINTRSYGADPRLDARLGAAFVRCLQANGMMATGKHFPGHGDTGVNSHLALPVVTASRARLDTVELVPFRAAIAAGVGAIMSFHGSMPALDSSGAPGTLSPKVLTGLLRGELGFEGLVISDAMDMRGVLDRYGPVEAAKLAVAAGADVLIQPLDVAQTIDAIVSGVSEGRFPASRVDASARRILAAKYRLGLARERLVDLDHARAVVGDSAHRADAARAAERSITLYRDSLRQVPIGRLSSGARILSITFAPRAELYAGVAFDSTLRRRFPALRSEFVSADDPGRDFWRLLAVADSADVVLVGSYVAHAWNVSTIEAPRAFTDFVEQLVGRGIHPILIAFGNPYLLQQVPEVPAYLVAWGGFPVSQRAAARALLGETPITGRLPIDIPPLAPIGAGEQRPAITTAP